VKYNIKHQLHQRSACDVQIEADDINLNPEAETVSFYKDPKGTSFVKTIAILTLVPGMKIIGDDRSFWPKNCHRCLALVVPDPPSTISEVRGTDPWQHSQLNRCSSFMPPPAPLPTELHNLKVNRLEPGSWATPSAAATSGPTYPGDMIFF